MKKNKKKLEKEVGDGLKLVVGEMLKKHKGNKAKAAEALRISRYTLNLIVGQIEKDKEKHANNK